MEKMTACRLARVLKILVTAVFVCNLATLFLVPGLAMMRSPEIFSTLASYDKPAEVLLLSLAAFAFAWLLFWLSGPYTVVLALFLLFCGVCTAVLLWQARRILGTLTNAMPFRRENADSMRRAAVCCFCIAGASLVRICWGFWFYQSLRPLLTYNALFFPLFLMGGLLCMVMSALFRQAAALKEENDLTI